MLITRQKLSNALKSLKSKKSFTGIDQSSKRASGCHSPPHIYNSLLRMRAIHELKIVCSTEKSSWPNLHLRILAILLALFSASVMIFKTKVIIDKYLNESFCDFLVITYWAKQTNADCLGGKVHFPFFLFFLYFLVPQLTFSFLRF